jgi:hypothetical protein
MIVIPPIAITPAMLVAINAVDAPAWAVGSTYALGDSVSRNYRNWVSLQAANLGKTPETEPLWWRDDGPCNTMAMFDSAVATASSRTGGLSWTLDAGRFTALGLMGLVGQSVTVSIADGATVIYSKTRTLQKSDGTYFSFCFDEFLQTRETAFYGLPSTPTARITVSITGPELTACGLCVLGKQFAVGDAQYGFSVPIEDRGRHYLDALGNPVNLERGYSKGVSGTISTTRANFNRLTGFFADYIGVPCLWVAAPDQNDLISSTVFGRYIRAVPVISGPVLITANLEIAGYR